MPLLSVRWKAAFLLVCVCFTMPRALHRRGSQEDDPSPQVTWADVMGASAAWWKHNRSTSRTEPAAGGNSENFPQTIGEAFDSELPLVGVSPMGDPQFDCEAEPMQYKGLNTCTPAVLAKYKDLSPEIVDESKVTALLDLAIYAARDEANGVKPCRWLKQHTVPEPPHTNRFDVVFDPQYSAQPACCSLKNMPPEDIARTFKDGEQHAVHSGNITAYTMDGIRYGSYGEVVYSILEPTSVECSEARKCPLVVEIPGAATVPWLLLQAWCTGCQLELGTIVLSLDDVEHPGTYFVQHSFIPAVQDFLKSHAGIDRSRVYLTSTSRGNEIGMLAVLLHPEIFTFALFAGKSLMTEELKEAAKNVKVPAAGQKLRKISFHVGSDDNIHDDDQDYWARMELIVKPLAIKLDMELRYYPGGTHAMWYAGWNAYRDLLWTGKKSIRHYIKRFATTCAPP